MKMANTRDGKTFVSEMKIDFGYVVTNFFQVRDSISSVRDGWRYQNG